MKAQNTISQQKLIRSPQPDSTYFLSLWALPGSIVVTAGSDTLSPGLWSFVPATGIWSLRQNIPSQFRNLNTLTINYEILPLSLSRVYGEPAPPVLRRTDLENSDSLETILSTGRNSGIFESTRLRQQGSLSRGIIVGSNQDFSLESGLNFELTGQLTEDISINASLTDQSIPIQPDGTTQNLREFDQVYIELSAPNADIRMGDIDVSLQQNIFSKYNRRLQGATASFRPGAANYSGALSVVRGTFKTINFQGSDGVQGPYRLTGRNDEPFVIVLAGTERVYINGQQVQRGADNDYIIDYGLGEIFFTENILIKDETRIFVEYEYIDQDFNRTLMAAEASDTFWDGKFTLGASVIRQTDGDELLSQQNLSENDIDLLKTVGDDLDNAIVDGATIATEEERDQFVIYTLRDTTLNGQVYQIYENRPGFPGNIYRVRFSQVGDGQGAYQRVGGTVNGILYEWVGPGNGSYEPFRQLPAPENHQMVALNTKLNPGDKFEWYGEWALSDYDRNRFSTIGNGDNTDLAYNTGIRLKDLSLGKGRISAELNSRYSGRNFEFFERTREIEFSRRWNLSSIQNNREQINTARINWNPQEHTSISLEGGLINRDGFDAGRQSAAIRSGEKAFIQTDYLQEWIRSEDKLLGQRSDWFRQIGSVSKAFNAGELIMRPYLSFWQEDRRQRSIASDSLTSLSQRFYELGPGLNISYAGFTIDGSVVSRNEKDVIDNTFRDQSSAIEQRYAFSYEGSDYFRTRNEIKLREKDFTEAFELQGQQNREGLFLRSQTEYRTASDLLDGELTYRVNTQRQSLLQESYIEVGPELGQYVWRDINQDGVQQIDEFFPELSPNEGLYVRQFLPSDDLLPVVDLNLRTIHRIHPLLFLGESDLLKGVELISRVDIRENSRTDDLADVYFLRLNTFREDSTTLQGRLFWEKELDLLGGIDEGDLRIGFNQNRSFNRRSSESLRNYNDNYFLNASLRPGSTFNFSLSLLNGRNRSISDRLSSRNFNIETWDLSPGLSAVINRSWQADLGFSYIDKRDRFPAEEVRARILKWTTSQRAYLWERIQTNSRVEIRNTIVDGNSSSFGIFELTEGTGEGTNLLWSVNANYRLSSLVRLSFNYDGRTVKNRPSVHTIKLVVSAVF
ncbi:hypothetical protein AB2B38_003910 [Balneola sp. MJW-20]